MGDPLAEDLDDARRVHRVALVGAMATGKSTVARLLAEALGWDAVDTDDEIEARTGRTVRELWEAGGEAAYRPEESAATLAGLARDRVVVAVPGGAVLDAAVADALRRPGTAVAWLRGSAAVLAVRAGASGHRPLLGDDPAAVLERLVAERAERYAAVADAVVDVDRASAVEVADAVRRAVLAGRSVAS